MRLLLVGQAPGPNTNPREPLHPEPGSSAGGRLAKLIGLTPVDYLATFDRINLIYRFPGQTKNEDRFPRRDARIAADAIRPLLPGRRVVFVGRNVAEAFGYPAAALPYHTWGYCLEWGFDFACVPHTSGRSLWYNHPDNVAASKSFWHACVANMIRPTYVDVVFPRPQD